ncbi:hypothetical protein BC829DRAFT_286403 [Chytridium lagenaria]|nr:hypothetical protein BC829DRAFT_286403 [Chytridium lagenaria]
MSELATAASRTADTFVENIYKIYDKQRHLMLNVYKDSAAILWNGNAFNGVASYLEFFLKLPVTIHETQSYDAQPICGDAESNLLITVTGNVKYEGKDKTLRPSLRHLSWYPLLTRTAKKKCGDPFRLLFSFSRFMHVLCIF